MSSHWMNRPASISVFSDQRRTKSTIWSRVSCGTQTPVRVPQLFFLGQHAPPSVQPKLHPSSGSSSPNTRFVPVRVDGWSVLFVGKPQLRSRKTPSASGRTRLAGVPVRHTDPRSALLPPNAASEWRPSLPVCSASVASSCVRSVILTDERFLHFQLRQDRYRPTVKLRRRLVGATSRIEPSVRTLSLATHNGAVAERQYVTKLVKSDQWSGKCGDHFLQADLSVP